MIIFKNLNVRNCSAKTQSALSIFPTGDYKMILDATVGREFLGSVTMIGSVTSSNRDTFG